MAFNNIQIPEYSNLDKKMHSLSIQIHQQSLHKTPSAFSARKKASPQMKKLLSNNFKQPRFDQIKLFMSGNPEADLSPQLIFKYDTHRNIPWNDTEYQPPHVYQDPQKQITQRKYLSTPKGGKDNNYVTRRGFYMDYHIKVVKALPASVDHPPHDPWDQATNQKKSQFNKLDLSLSKYSYLDRIQMEQKNRATPAPGSYHLNKTDEQIQKYKADLKTKKRYEGEKHFFYEDTEYIANNLAPGSGCCNPHQQVDHIKMNKTTHKFWIQKHKKEGFKMQKRKSVEPAPGTHTPVPLGYTTFDRIMTADQIRKKKKDKSPFNGFGSDAKFEYTRPSKKKIIEERPAPCAYSLALQWKGKNMDLKGNNWIRSRSYGRSQSVYH